MPALLSRSHIICLPSYHEGVPKALLVAVRDAAALGVALETLIRDPGLRRTMGASARERALQRFAAHIINEQVIDLYQRMNQA